MALQIKAWRGEEGPMGNGLDAARRDAEARGDGRLLTVADYADAVLHNAHGRYEAALAAARAADERRDLAFDARVLPELIEAAARTGAAAVAAAALERLGAQARLTGSDWALGLHATGHALVSEGAAAEALYSEGAERLDRTGIVIYQARAHLLYGEWLRRERRRLDARNELRIAHDRFVAMGATAFAERAGREIAATGEYARMRTVATLDQLTPQEERIARLASRGSTNQEIGAQLFISPRTVEYHLHKVFNKLDITSRAQLAQALD
jgi:DNA-binding CsgD family transcriptional regulator